jgi:hypothetical protein
MLSHKGATALNFARQSNHGASPGFLLSLLDSAKFMRLSLKSSTGVADPRDMTNPRVAHPSLSPRCDAIWTAADQQKQLISLGQLSSYWSLIPA